MGTCGHCRNGWFDPKSGGYYFGQDVECVNGVLIDIDVYTEGWGRDHVYPVAPCHPCWEKQQREEDFNNDCQRRLEEARMTPQANQPSADVPEDEPAHIDILRGEIGALLGFGDKPVTNEEEQSVEIILRAVQRHYRILGERRALDDRQAREEARDGGGWRVRDLKWARPAGCLTLNRASTTIGAYRVWTHVEAAGEWFWEFADITGGLVMEGNGRSEEDAKAAAQADYEARIRSAIEPSPVEGDRQ